MKLFDWMRGARHVVPPALEVPPAVAAARAIGERGEAERAIGLMQKIVAAGLSARRSGKVVDACKVFDCRVIVVPAHLDVTFKRSPNP